MIDSTKSSFLVLKKLISAEKSGSNISKEMQKAANV